MTLTVYVTGCLGFIGAYVTEACLQRGWHVIGVDKMTYASQPEKLAYFNGWGPNYFKFIKSDINDLDRLPDVDYIINTAAETHVDNSIVSSEEFLHSNVNGVHHLLELVRSKERFRMPTLLHFSTDEVYGDLVTGSHKETDLLKPSNPYSATKAAADMLILAWNRTFKVPYIIVRPTNNYGMGQYPEKLIPKTCKLLQMGKKIPLHNNGTPKRIWLHAQDTANAVIHIIESQSQNEIFNISGNIEIQNWKLVAKIANILNIQPSRIPLFEEPNPPSIKGVSSSQNGIKVWGLSENEREGNYYLYGDMNNGSDNLREICDFSYHRTGQDIRYSLCDDKLKTYGWTPKCVMNDELPSIIEYYKNNFVW